MGVSEFGTHVRILTPCVIIRTPYTPLYKLYIIDEPIINEINYNYIIYN